MIHLLRTILFYLIFGAVSLVMVPVTALLAPFAPRIMRLSARIWSTIFVWSARMLLGMRLVVRGKVPQSAVLVAAKHQSYYEAIITLYLFDQASVVMKTQLHHIPLWGSIARHYGSIFVAREKQGSALRSMLKQARARSEEGRPIFIFPEGTRTAVGTAPALKSGLYALYRGLDVPLVPVALDAGRCWAKGFVKKSGTITISFLPDIPPGLPRSEMEARVHAAINTDPVTAEVRT